MLRIKLNIPTIYQWRCIEFCASEYKGKDRTELFYGRYFISWDLDCGIFDFGTELDFEVTLNDIITDKQYQLILPRREDVFGGFHIYVNALTDILISQVCFFTEIPEMGILDCTSYNWPIRSGDKEWGKIITDKFTIRYRDADFYEDNVNDEDDVNKFAAASRGNIILLYKHSVNDQKNIKIIAQGNIENLEDWMLG